MTFHTSTRRATRLFSFSLVGPFSFFAAFLSLALTIATGAVPVLAQSTADGTLDFPYDTLLYTGVGQPANIDAIAKDSVGRILIAGNFTCVLNPPASQCPGQNIRMGLARLNPDGSLDSTFDPGSGLDGGSGLVVKIIVLASGKILIAGQFTNYQGILR